MLFQIRLVSNNWHYLNEKILELLFDLKENSKLNFENSERELARTNLKLKELIKENIEKRQKNIEEINKSIKQLEDFKQKLIEDIKSLKNPIVGSSLSELFTEKDKYYTLKQLTDILYEGYKIHRSDENIPENELGWYTIRKLFDVLHEKGFKVDEHIISKDKIYKSFESKEQNPDFDKSIEKREWQGKGSRQSKKTYEFRLNKYGLLNKNIEERKIELFKYPDF